MMGTIFLKKLRGQHGIFPVTSAHWLSTQLDFKKISGHWVKIESINETAGKSLVHKDVMTCCLQIGFFQSIRPAKWPIRFDCVTNKPVDCNETKHDWKSHVLSGLRSLWLKLLFFVGLYAQIIASYYFAVNPFLNLTTQLD